MLRRMFLPALLVALVALVAVACGGDEEAEKTATPQGTASPTASPSPEAIPEPGSAGIASKPRDVPGFEGAWKLDDGLAMFKTRPASEDRTGVTADSVKVCIPVALTGPVAVWTEGQKLIKEGVDRINQLGGIHGRKIEILVRDDASSPGQAVQVAKQFVEQDGCFMIFAHGSLIGAIQAVVPYVVDEKVPYFGHFDPSLNHGDPGAPNDWSGSLSVVAQYKRFGDFIYERNPNEKLALIYSNDSFGQAARQGWEAGAAANNTTLVSAIPISPGAPDYSGEVGQALQANPTAIVLSGYFNDQPKLIKSLREGYGSQIQIYDPGGLSVVSRQGLPEGMLDGLIGSFSGYYGESATQVPGVVAANKILTDAGLYPSYFAILSGQGPIEHLARALACAGPDLTREGFTQAVNGGCFDGSWTCSVCLAPSIVTPADRWMLDFMQVTQWDDKNVTWKNLGDVVSYEVAYGRGARGNFPEAPCSDETPCPWEEDCTPDSADRCAWQPAFE